MDLDRYRLRIQIRIWNSDPDLGELKIAPKNSKKEKISSLTNSPEILELLLEPERPLPGVDILGVFCSIFVYNCKYFKICHEKTSVWMRIQLTRLSKTLVEIQFHYSVLYQAKKNIRRGSKKPKLSKMRYLPRL